MGISKTVISGQKIRMASLNFVIFETENPSIFGYFEEKCKCLHVTKSAFTYYWAFYGTSHTHIQISFSQIMTCSGKNSGFFLSRNGAPENFQNAIFRIFVGLLVWKYRLLNGLLFVLLVIIYG